MIKKPKTAIARGMYFLRAAIRAFTNASFADIECCLLDLSCFIRGTKSTCNSIVLGSMEYIYNYVHYLRYLGHLRLDWPSGIARLGHRGQSKFRVSFRTTIRWDRHNGLDEARMPISNREVHYYLSPMNCLLDKMNKGEYSYNRQWEGC